jgi:hypothetical protein
MLAHLPAMDEMHRDQTDQRDDGEFEQKSPANGETHEGKLLVSVVWEDEVIEL